MILTTRLSLQVSMNIESFALLLQIIHFLFPCFLSENYSFLKNSCWLSFRANDSVCGGHTCFQLAHSALCPY